MQINKRGNIIEIEPKFHKVFFFKLYKKKTEDRKKYLVLCVINYHRLATYSIICMNYTELFTVLIVCCSFKVSLPNGFLKIFADCAVVIQQQTIPTKL